MKTTSATGFPPRPLSFIAIQVLVALLVIVVHRVSSFTTITRTRRVVGFQVRATATTTTATRSRSSTTLTGLRMIGFIPTEDEIAKQLARATELIEKCQAKINEQEQNKDNNHKDKKQQQQQQQQMQDKRQMVTKATQNGTGLITTDGEMMAKLSEEEEWQSRSLMEVFEDEMNNDLFEPETGLFFASTNTTKKLAERDVVASIRNLQTTMNMNDFRQIFDSGNYFIGEQ